MKGIIDLVFWASISTLIVFNYVFLYSIYTGGYRFLLYVVYTLQGYLVYLLYKSCLWRCLSVLCRIILLDFYRFIEATIRFVGIERYIQIYSLFIGIWPIYIQLFFFRLGFQKWYIILFRSLRIVRRYIR